MHIRYTWHPPGRYLHGNRSGDPHPLEAACVCVSRPPPPRAPARRAAAPPRWPRGGQRGFYWPFCCLKDWMEPEWWTILTDGSLPAASPPAAGRRQRWGGNPAARPGPPRPSPAQPTPAQLSPPRSPRRRRCSGNGRSGPTRPAAQRRPREWSRQQPGGKRR